jgi:hypothetical protein
MEEIKIQHINPKCLRKSNLVMDEKEFLQQIAALHEIIPVSIKKCTSGVKYEIVSNLLLNK